MNNNSLLWFLQVTSVTERLIITRESECTAHHAKRKKGIIKHFDADNYVVEDVSHSNDEIESNVILDSCEIPIDEYIIH